MKVVVVGGGISGLTASYLLTKAGHDVRCLEPSERAGGLIRTELRQGFLCETGPQALLDGAPDTRALIDDLGLGGDVVRASAAARRRMIYIDGRLRVVPTDPFSLVGSDLLSASGKWRLVREPFVKPRTEAEDEEETIYEFGERRLGPEAARALVAPATIGIFAGDASELVMKNAFPKLAALEARYGSVVKGLRALRKEGGGGGKAISFRDGLERLPRTIAERLGGWLVRGAVRAIHSDGGRWRVDTEGGSGAATLEADAVVLAAPPAVTGALLAPLAPEAGEALQAIPIAPAAIVALGFPRAETGIGFDLDAYGFLVARGERASLLGCQFESTVFPGRAPPGSILLRVIMGGAFDTTIAEQSEEQLQRRAVEELRLIAGLSRAPEFVAVWRWKRAIPQYVKGHEARTRVVEAAVAARPGLHVLGYALRGIGVNDCIRNAATLARAIGPA